MNSGYQAINLTVLTGAARILLLGYDGKVANGKTHFFGDHPEKEIPSVYDMYRRMLRQLPPLLNGIKVLNCSPDSAVDAFPKMTLEAALASLEFDARSRALSASSV